MEAKPFTRFPNLCGALEPETSPCSVPLRPLSATEDDRLRAWACLLRGYTGIEDNVSFLADETRVDCGEDGSLTAEDCVERLNESDANVTGVFFQPGHKPQNLAVGIYFSSSAEPGCVWTNGLVPCDILEQIAELLHVIVTRGARSLSSLPASEARLFKQSILNQSPRRQSGPVLLHECLGYEERLDDTAIEYFDDRFGRTSITYGELKNKSQRLARKIREIPSLKNRVHQTIPLFLPQKPSLYIAMLAVLQAGHAFCPLQLDAPPERLRFIIDDIEALVVVTEASLSDRIQSLDGAHIIDIDEILQAKCEDDSELPGGTQLDPKGTAYVMYTSGSTGTPKGVPVSHSSATQSLLAHDRHLPDFSRFLQFAAPTFDVSIFEIFFTLYRHQCLVICNRATLLNDLPAALREMKIDAAELTPTVAGTLLQRRDAAPTLKLLLTIGEMLTPYIVSEFGGDGNRESTLWGMYGPTEAAIHCTLQPAFTTSMRPSNIGFPLDTVSAFIASQEKESESGAGGLHLLPQGFVGELVVGGLQLANGYLNRPEQTSNAFINTTEFGTVYRTGDKARMLADGTIECLGRIATGQVKLRGQRIELGEVRHALAQTQGCLDAFAGVVDASLVAFCLVSAGTTVENLLESCRAWLPTFMVPATVLILEQLPRLPSGKIDIKALEQRFREGQHSGHNQPCHETDPDVLRFCAVLRDITGRQFEQEVPMDSLGVDSLLAIRAASRLRDAGFSVSPLDLLGRLSVNQLARRRSSERSSSPKVAQSVPVSDDQIQTLRSLGAIETLLPCTPVQAGMLTETVKNASMYWNQIEVEIHGSHTIDDMVKWWKKLGHAHSMLRSGFLTTDSGTDPFVCVTWNEFDDAQVIRLRDSHRQPVSDEQRLLRPLDIQVDCREDKAYMIINLHHAIYDGWSIDVLLSDLESLANGKDPDRVSDFNGVTSYYRQVDTTAALDFWQDQLADFVPMTFPNLNADVVDQPSVERASFEFTIGLNRLQEFAADLHIGKSVALQIAVGFVLSQYCGISEVTFGLALSGRSIPVANIENVFGPCLVTCPLRLTLTPEQKLADLLRATETLNRQLMEHSIVPLQVIKQACGVATDTAMWDVLFVWQESLESRAKASSKVQLLRSEDRLECTLTLEFEPHGARILSRATFDDSKLSGQQVCLLLRQIDDTLGSILDYRDSRLGEMEQDFASEILSIANPVPDTLQFTKGLEHAVEQHAVDHPQDLALIFAADIRDVSVNFVSLSYKELNGKANQLAHYLQAGTLHQELVAICMEKSPELYVAILAVLKLGLGYLPITPSTPSERIKTIISEANIALCITQRNVSSDLSLGNACELVLLDELNLSTYPRGNLSTEFDGSRPAYAVFTSGSTGTPKGVVVTQQNLLSNLAVLSELYPVERGDRLLQACSQAFDVSVFEIFFTWRAGMCLCSAPNDVLFLDLERSIQALEVTHLSLTPTVAALVNPDNVPKVKFLVTAGEAVTSTVKNRWSDRGLYQGYGRRDAIENIGSAFRNTSAFVLDPLTDKILMRGALGELCFGGDQIFRGYMNQPELTASRIVNHPEYSRLYRSGDSGRMLADGSILFAARLDDQVKIRGQRVELHEINHQVLRGSDVKDCATLLLDNAEGSKTLVSFFVPHRKAEEPGDRLILSIDESTLETSRSITLRLQEYLPSYMWPSLLVPISYIPMTTQSKIDRRRLARELQDLSAADIDKFINSNTPGDDQSDWTLQEKLVLEALSSTLKKPLEGVNRQTPFLSVGLDSISAIAMSKHLQSLLKKRVAVSHILQNPSIARLTLKLDSIHEQEQTERITSDLLLPEELITLARDACAKVKVDVAQVLPCTPLQQAMLSSSLYSKASYINTMMVRIGQNSIKVKDAWNEICEQQPIFRTIFLSTMDVDTPFVQVQLENAEIRWFESSIKSVGELRRQATQRVDNELASTVGTFQPPYILQLMTHGNEQFLQFSCHHALYDGSATSILFGQIEARLHGGPVVEAVDYKLFLAEVARQQQADHHRYWAAQLEGFQPTLLKVDGSEQFPTSFTLHGALRQLEDACSKSSVSVLSALQLSWAVVLAAICETSDVCFGNVVSGRNVPIRDVENLIAPTFNTVPFRLMIDVEATASELMKKCQRQNANALDHQLHSLRSIIAATGHGQHGLFPSVLLLQQSELELDPSIWTLEYEEGIMDFPMLLEVTPNRSEGTLSATLHCNKSLLKPADAEAILRSLSTALDFLSTDSKRPVSELGLQLHKELQHVSRQQLLRSIPKSSGRSQTDSPTKLSGGQQRVLKVITALRKVDVAKVRPDSTIHELGIDSISAIQVAAKLREEYSVSISAADVLGNPTIDGVAKLLQARNTTSSSPSSALINLNEYHRVHIEQVRDQLSFGSDAVRSVWPCTPLQVGLIAQFTRTKAYANHMTYSFGSEFSSEEIHEAWALLAKDTPILRTGFVSLEDDPKTPFAMVTYDAQASIPSKIQAIQEGIPFDVQSWRSTQVASFHQDLSMPPWAVAVQRMPDMVVLHLTIFHGLYDAACLRMMLEGLSQILRGGQGFVSADIQPLLQDILAGASSDESLHFWEHTLREGTFSAFPDLTPLRSESIRASTVAHPLEMSVDDLQRACSTRGLTLQAVGQAAWARLLWAYTGEQDVCFGMVISGRETTAGAEKMVFPSITTVPFRVSVDGQSNEALAREAMQFNASVRKHQFCRMDEVRRKLGRNILFDTIFALQYFDDGQNYPSWELLDEQATDEYTIALELEPGSHGNMVAKAAFDEALVAPEHAVLIVKQYVALLKEILDKPTQSCKQLPTNDTSLTAITPPRVTSLPTPVSLLHQFVEYQAEQIPNRIAFEFFDRDQDGSLCSRKWTYEKLNAEGEQVAAWLGRQGLPHESHIGICFEKCPEASFAILGILKAGHSYVAIDPSAPVSRKILIAEDSQLPLVLTTRTEMAVIGDLIEKVRVIALDDPELKMDEAARQSKPSGLGPDSTCYCLYTSGSTGTPKGCLISQENAVQAMRAFSKLFAGRWDAKSRWLQFASFHFDVSVLEQYWSWSEGICVVSAPRDLIFEDIEGTIRDMGITHIDLTPSLASLVRPENVPSLCKGVFITGGEQLKQEILDVWGSEKVIHNGYGPTETTIGVTMFPRVPANGKPANIGSQFENVGTYVLRPDSEEPVFRGGIGELCVAGKLVGKGYLNRPELTTEKFPFLNTYRERVYRTGDLVRCLADGSFLFLGRIDDQIKLRGQRLEIGEINATIQKAISFSGDVTTLVTTHPKQQRDQLVTFFATRGRSAKKDALHVLDSVGAQRLAAQARNACLQALPGYMVPTFFLPVNRIPLSSNNKTDIKKLTGFFHGLSHEDLQKLSSPEDATVSSAEKDIIRVLADFTNIDVAQLSPSSNLFELGLDSIAMISLAAKFRRSGWKDASAASMMKVPTVRGLASSLSSKPSQQPGAQPGLRAARHKIGILTARYRFQASRAFGIAEEMVQKIAPCTSLQEGMLLKGVETENDPPYFNTFQLQLAPGVSDDHLVTAWRRLFDECEILRVRLLRTNDGYMQVACAGEIPLRYIELDAEQFDDAVANTRRDWIHANRVHFPRPFELIIWRLPSKRILSLHIFHALYDGNSFPALLLAVKEMYENNEVGVGPSFLDFVASDPERSTDQAKKFWTGHMQPRSRPQLEAAGKPKSLERLIKTNGQLEECSRNFGVSRQAVLQAAWAASLACLSSCRTISLGVVTSGRLTENLDDGQILGPMFNTIPALLELKSGDIWESLSGRCHAFNVSSLAYRRTPVQQIRKWCKLPVGDPVFDSIFVFQKASIESADASKNELWEICDGTSTPDFALAIEIEVRLDGELLVTLASTGDTVNAHSLEEIVEMFEGNILAASTGEDDRLAAVTEALPPEISLSDNALLQHGSSNAMRSTSQYEWNYDARILRQEIARLTSLPEEQIDPHASLFELGLDSIDVIRLSSRCSALGLQLAVSFVMQNPTIEAMAQKRSSGNEAMHATNILPQRVETIQKHLQDVGRWDPNFERVLPTTPLQEAMLAEMLWSGHTRYFNHDILRLGDSIDAQKLRHAWEKVVSVSPILRTEFLEIDEPAIECSFAQVILHEKSLPWHEVEIFRNGVDVEQRMSDLCESMQESVQGIASFRLTLVSTDGAAYLILSLAHALYDGFSLGMLHQDVRSAYAGELGDQRPSIDPFLEEVLESSNSQSSEKFWSDHLSNIPPCVLDTDNSSSGHLIREESVGCISAADMRAFCKQQGITPQTLGQACFSIVVASYLERLDVVFGITLSGRDSELTQQMLFPTMNTVAYRSSLYGSKAEFIRATQESMAEIRAHQYYPLRKAQRLVNTHGSRLFDTLFIFQSQPGRKGAAEPLYETVSGSSGLEFSLCVELEFVDDEAVWRAAWREGVFTRKGGLDVLQEIEKACEHIMQEPDGDLVVFEDDAVRIGQLPRFKDRDISMIPSSTESDGISSKSDSPEIMADVQAVLATVAQIPTSEVTPEATLYHLGLDSISAIRVASLLKRKGHHLPVSLLLRAPNVAGIAALADAQLHQSNGVEARENGGNAQLQLSNGDDAVNGRADASFMFTASSNLADGFLGSEFLESELPATAGQQYMLCNWQQSKGRLFHDTFYFSVTSTEASAQDIRGAFEHLVTSEPILRTIFVANTQADVPIIQVVLRPDVVRLLEIDSGTRHGVNGSVKAAQKWEYAMYPPAEMGLEQTFVSLSHYEHEAGLHKLGLKIHHALYDGVSLPALLSKLEQAIHARTRSLQPTSMASFVMFVNGAFAARQSTSVRDFWTNYLRDATSAQKELPADSHSHRISKYLPGFLPDASKLVQVARQHGVSLAALFLCMYARTYAALSHHKGDQIVVGIYIANRAQDSPELETFPTVNLLPLKIDMGREIFAAITKIQEDLRVISEMENVNTTLEDIYKWTGVEVNTFVNWVSSPSSTEDPVVGNVDKFRVREAIDDTIVDEGTQWRAPKELRKLALNGYKPAIDVEVAVRDNALDVGLFCPMAMLTADQSQHLLENLKRALLQI